MKLIRSRLFFSCCFKSCVWWKGGVWDPGLKSPVVSSHGLAGAGPGPWSKSPWPTPAPACSAVFPETMLSGTAFLWFRLWSSSCCKWMFNSESQSIQHLPTSECCSLKALSYWNQRQKKSALMSQKGEFACPHSCPLFTSKYLLDCYCVPSIVLGFENPARHSRSSIQLTF